MAVPTRMAERHCPQSAWLSPGSASPPCSRYCKTRRSRFFQCTYFQCSPGWSVGERWSCRLFSFLSQDPVSRCRILDGLALRTHSARPGSGWGSG
jgi:hypothetical protein